MRHEDPSLQCELGSLWLGSLDTGWEAAESSGVATAWPEESSLRADQRNELQGLSPAPTGLA